MYYQLEERIEDMKPQDIAYLTKDFILKFAPTKINRIWNKLSEELQKDKDMISHRRCREHYNPIVIDYDEFDGMIPLIKDCSICKERLVYFKQARCEHCCVVVHHYLLHCWLLNI
ncbi:hypothetical protein PV326_005593 [Microctonus aethiopoides]|nr:hypothetical protein PV326_005593 [Microctonus aethiopoides]